MSPLEASLAMPETLESEALRLIIDSLPTGTIIVDQTGRFVMLNRTIIEWFGYSKEEVLGQIVEFLIPERFTRNHPAYREDYFSNPKVRPMGSGIGTESRRRGRPLRRHTATCGRRTTSGVTSKPPPRQRARRLMA